MKQHPVTDNIFSGIIIPEPLTLDISRLSKGIDNFRVDIRLSGRLKDEVNYLIKDLLRREIENSDAGADVGGLFKPLRQSYQDLMSVLLHSARSGRDVESIRFLQFAVPSHIHRAVGAALDDYKANLQYESSELRRVGSPDVLKVHNRLAWLNKHYKLIAYRIRRRILLELHQVEQQKLKPLRAQYGDSGFSEFLVNPILAGGDPASAMFLIENYLYWGGSTLQSDFPEINRKLENFLARLFPEFSTTPLMSSEPTPATPEVFDEQNGLKSLEPYLGVTVNTGETIGESFCWLDSPQNMDYLFNVEKFHDAARDVRREHGLRVWWRHRRVTRKLERGRAEIAHFCRKEKLLGLFAASIETNNIWLRQLGGEMDPKLICQYLCGQIDMKKLQNTALGGKVLNEREKQVLEESLRVVARKVQKAEEWIPQVMIDLARFRRHLKYSRFAQRIFNRMNLLSRDSEIRLSQQADTLNSLFCSEEVRNQSEDKVVHHTILKADVRGSTAVTEILEQKDLNAASYFSLHFFRPINDLLSLYGANKVFVEGDAIILSFPEYEGRPHEWFSVTRACALGKAMLNIIRRNNSQAMRMGLPVLEFGIGICYSPEGPRYLFDGDRPVMISSAISIADRLSSSSAALRERVRESAFNVEVVATEDEGAGKEGVLAANVNGIRLDQNAFQKLKDEIRLLEFSMAIDGTSQKFYLGKSWDLEGSHVDILIRKGRVAPAEGDAEAVGDYGRNFYEAVVNEKLIAELVEKSGMRKATSSR